MKYLSAVIVYSLFIFAGCKKDSFLTDEIEVQVIHHTCVQTILRCDEHNIIFIREDWQDPVDGVVYTNAFNAGIQFNAPEDITPGKKYRAKIKKTGSLTPIACDLLDVKGTNKLYDVEYIR